MKVFDILRDFLYQKFHVLPMFHLKKGENINFSSDWAYLCSLELHRRSTWPTKRRERSFKQGSVSQKHLAISRKWMETWKIGEYRWKWVKFHSWSYLKKLSEKHKNSRYTPAIHETCIYVVSVQNVVWMIITVSLKVLKIHYYLPCACFSFFCLDLGAMSGFPFSTKFLYSIIVVLYTVYTHTSSSLPGF